MDKVQYFKVGLYKQWSKSDKYQTLKSVAERIGISPGVFSKLKDHNNSYHASEKTRQRVLKEYGMSFDEMVMMGRRHSAYIKLLARASWPA